MDERKVEIECINGDQPVTKKNGCSSAGYKVNQKGDIGLKTKRGEEKNEKTEIKFELKWAHDYLEKLVFSKTPFCLRSGDGANDWVCYGQDPDRPLPIAGWKIIDGNNESKFVLIIDEGKLVNKTEYGLQIHDPVSNTDRVLHPYIQNGTVPLHPYDSE